MRKAACTFLCLGGVLLSFVTAVRFEANVISFQTAAMYLIISGLSVLAGIEIMQRLELEYLIARHIIIKKKKKSNWEKLSPEWKSYFLGFDDV